MRLILDKLKIMICLILLVLGVSVTAYAAGSAKKPFVIVIDAGHGGKDVGAVDNGAREKDINLGVALQLGDMLKKKMKDVEVIYTRDDDTFKSLQQRADIANAAKANLFISIHTNSLDANNPKRTTVEGASVYVLGLHKDDDNKRVAQRENAVIQLENDKESYAGFDPNSDESYIIFEMAQKKNLSNSIKFAELAEKQLQSVAERKGRGVHQAGFWVLWATSMPGVLVEVDFICNPKSASFISSSSGQKKLAEGLFKAVEQYRKELKLAEQREKKAAKTATADPSMPQIASVGGAKVTTAPPKVKASGKSHGQRRRRSEAARRASANHDYETDYIAVNTHANSAAVTETEAPQVAMADVDADEDDSPKNKKKNRKERKVKPRKSDKQAKEPKKEVRVVNGREVVVNELAPERRKTAKENSQHAQGKSRARNRSISAEDTTVAASTETKVAKQEKKAETKKPTKEQTVASSDSKKTDAKAKSKDKKSKEQLKEEESHHASNRVKGAFAGSEKKKTATEAAEIESDSRLLRGSRSRHSNHKD